MSRAVVGGVGRLATFKQAEFEIQGKVQGVFFRKHTKAKADTLGIVGWVANTESGAFERCPLGCKA